MKKITPWGYPNLVWQKTEQAGAELGKAQVTFDVIDEVALEVGS